MEKIGLQAFWDNVNFTKGHAEYMAALQAASGATGQTAQTVTGLGQSGGVISNILGSISGALGITTGQLVGLTGALAIGKMAFEAISNAASNFISYMVTAEDSAINVASRINEMNLAAQAMGQQVGMTGTEVNALVKQLTSMEIGQRDANQVVADFARYGLDMTKIIDLATVAENASVLAGKSATDTFSDLATGIERMMVRQLKSSGIVLNATDAYAKYAAELGKDASALTEAEQQQAFFNEVLAKGANLAGLHEVAMRTAAEQMDKLKSKTLPGLSAALGAPFQAAFFNVVKGINDIISSFTSLIKEGGALYPVMIKLGAIFEIMTEPIRMLGDTVKSFSDDTLTSFGDSISNTISAALDWGANLVINFANGMINAASTVLTAAINWIASLLTFWMAPGSPPKFIPDIDVWGSELMDEYLKGFTEADFSVLSDIQGPIEAALGSLADMGDITKQAAAQLYVDLSEGMIQALAGGGLTSELLAQLTAAGGIYGDELVDIAQKEFELQAAQEAVAAAEQAVADNEKAVTDAEKAKADAEKRASAAGAEVNKGMMEYNQMLRSGAGKDALKSKLAQINASKKEQEAANKDVDTKQVAIDLAKAQLDASKAQLDATKENAKAIADQVKALEDMLKVMIDLNKAQIIAVTPEPVPVPTTPPGGGGAGKVTPTGGVGVEAFDPSLITDAIKTAIDAQVAAFKEKYGGMWDDTMAHAQIAWNKIVQAFQDSGLADVWEKIKTKAGDAWEWIKGEAQDVVNMMTDWWDTYGGDVEITWGNIKTTVGDVIDGILKLVGSLLEPAGKVFEGIWLFVKNWFGMIGTFIGTAISLAVAIITGKFERIPEIFNTFIEKMKGFAAGILLGVITFIWGIWDAISAIAKSIVELFNLQAVIDSIIAWGKKIWDYLFGGSLFPDILAAIITFISDFITRIVDWMTGIWTNITTKFDEIKAYIKTVSGLISAAWAVFWDAVHKKVSDIWDTIKTYISTKITEAKTTISTISGQISTAWTTFWDGVSTKVTEIWGAIVTGIGTKATEIKNAIAAIFTGPDGIFAKFTGWVTDMVTKGGELIAGLVSGVTGAARGLIDSVIAAVQGALNAVKDLLHIAHSPSELTKLWGKELMEGLSIGIDANVGMTRGSMKNAMVQTLAPAAQVPITMGSTNNYYQPNINMPTTINNGMNAAVFHATVKKVIRNEMNRK